jgi:hypothetical protein
MVAERRAPGPSFASYERSAELHLAFMLLGCAVVCQRMLNVG